MVFVKCSLFPSIFAIVLLVGLISVLFQHGYALKCKVGMETETYKFAGGKMMEEQACANATHCVAMFCSSAENGFFINMWGCVPLGAEDTEAKCEKEMPDNANKIRAGLEAQTKMPAPNATDWKCKCHFGAKGKDMDNEQFVAASSRHGVAMPLMAIGLIIGFLPLFRGAIFERLNDVIEVNKF
ncbi:hypothetical protein niasHT_039972 [Heterodera trifolii]|uniref:Uncharacterized protein n=1 Tax=Heterodera trifolii TaxID=157864 RepID=A0ABD2J5H2_9BILA